MIQRIQTVYLAIAIILLSSVTVGLELFSFVGNESTYVFNSFGITELNAKREIIQQTNYPVYIGLIALILLSFICLMSYKDLKRQFKLGRTIFYLYFLMVVVLLIISVFGDSILDIENAKRHLGLGFYLFVVGFPFTFLANTGIKRDKRLLESMDRLR